MMPALLVLEDGTFFPGLAFGHREEAIGEIACDTGLSNYHELLTDPTSKGRLIALTSSHIGNHGVCALDQESAGAHAEGLIVRNLSRIASNYRSDLTLQEFVKEHQITGITEVDTRALMIHVREHGAQMAAIVPNASETDVESIVQRLRNHVRYEANSFVEHVSTPHAQRVFFEQTNDPYHPHIVSLQPADAPWPTDLQQHQDVVVVDLGVRYSLLEGLHSAGLRITLVPFNASADNILAHNPKGVVFSNGPGNPEILAETAEMVRALLKKVPTFGVGLGAQLLAMANGGETFKQHAGDYAQNIPVRNSYSGRTDITTHRHAFGIRFPATSSALQITHINLNDQSVQGFHHTENNARGVLHHPEVATGRYGTSPLFDAFAQDLK